MRLAILLLLGAAAAGVAAGPVQCLSPSPPPLLPWTLQGPLWGCPRHSCAWSEAGRQARAGALCAHSERTFLRLPAGPRALLQPPEDTSITSQGVANRNLPVSRSAGVSAAVPPCLPPAHLTLMPTACSSRPSRSQPRTLQVGDLTTTAPSHTPVSPPEAVPKPKLNLPVRRSDSAAADSATGVLLPSRLQLLIQVPPVTHL